jgi:DNA-directed RNA polymerase delta subunit
MELSKNVWSRRELIKLDEINEESIFGFPVSLKPHSREQKSRQS